jgi:hypothetical protein
MVDDADINFKTYNDDTICRAPLLRISEREIEKITDYGTHTTNPAMW